MVGIEQFWTYRPVRTISNGDFHTIIKEKIERQHGTYKKETKY